MSKRTVGGRHRLLQNPFDGITLLLCAGVIGGFVVTHGVGVAAQPHPVARGLALAALLALFALVSLLEGKAAAPSQPLHHVFGSLLARIALIEGANIVEGFGMANMLYLIVPMKAFVYLAPPRAWVFSLLALGVFFARLSLLKPHWFSSATMLYTVLLFAVGLLLASTSAQLIARERRSRLQAEQLLDDLAVSHKRLAHYASQAAETAMLEERNRLARDIHDGLGHYLTAITIQLEKAAVFYTRRQDEALQALHDARRLSSEALDDVRQSVSSLRDAAHGFKLGAELHRLVRRVQTTGLPVTLTIEGDETTASKRSLLTLYRAAQEGLTNVQRHANAAHVVVHVRFAAHETVLTLTDDGCGFHEAVQHDPATAYGGAYGLRGLRERLALVNGTLTICSRHGHGTELTVRIPGCDHPPCDPAAR